jgi:hypothetical protein
LRRQDEVLPDPLHPTISLVKESDQTNLARNSRIVVPAVVVEEI